MTRNHELVTAFVLDYTEVSDVLAVILGALKVKEHWALFLFDCVVDIVIHSDIVIEELVGRFCLIRFSKKSRLFMV